MDLMVLTYTHVHCITVTLPIMHTEALVVVRDSAAGAVSDALSNLRGLRIKLSTVTIPETEDWGTADSLRHIRNKIHVRACVPELRAISIAIGSSYRAIL